MEQIQSMPVDQEEAAEKEKTAAEKRQQVQDQWVQDVLDLDDGVVITDKLRRKANRKYRRMEIKIKQRLPLTGWAGTVRYNGEVGRVCRRPTKADPA